MAIDALALAQAGWVPDDTFGDRLRAVRRHLNLRVEQIAEMCDVPLATWSSWEHGRRPRRLDEVVQLISRQTGVDRNWLMWGGYEAREVAAQSSPWITSGTLNGALAALGTSWSLLPPDPLDGDVVRLWPRLVPDGGEDGQLEVPAPEPAGDELQPAA